MDAFNDRATYRKMSEPFENPEKANAALKDFWKDLQELRKKHRIRDAHVVLSFAVMYGDKEGEVMWDGHLGDSLRAEPMLAYALGSTRAEHRETMAKLLAGGKP